MVKTYTAPGLSTIRGAQDRIDTILADYAQKRSEILTKPRLAAGDHANGQNTRKAEEELRAELNGAKQVTLWALEDLSTEVEDAHGEAADDIKRRLGGGKPSDSSAALLREMELTNAWNRMKPRLDRHDEPSAADRQLQELVKEAGLERDPIRIDALLREARPYFLGRGWDEAFILQAAQMLEGALSEIRPELAPVLAARVELEQDIYRARLSINYARTAVEKGEASVILVNPDDSVRTVTLAAPSGVR
ncbi:MAG: hypothetical protein ACK47B_09165 [Armatimonadota bacterium]